MATRSFSRTAKTTTRTTRTGAGHFPGEEGAAQSGPWTGFRQTTSTRGGGMAAAGESERLLERDDDEPRSSWCNVRALPDAPGARASIRRRFRALLNDRALFLNLP